MKSGNVLTDFSSKISLRDYQEAHVERECKGHFQMGFTINAFYTSSALGPIKLPCIPQVMCHTCGAAYTDPNFEEWVEKVITVHLVLSREGLIKKQIKFLRQFFGFTQEQLAEKIGLSGGKHELSKMESESSTRTMSSDTQVRMKMLFARLLKIKDAEELYKINEIDDSKILNIDPKWFPQEAELKKRVKTG